MEAFGGEQAPCRAGPEAQQTQTAEQARGAGPQPSRTPNQLIAEALERPSVPFARASQYRKMRSEFSKLQSQPQGPTVPKSWQELPPSAGRNARAYQARLGRDVWRQVGSVNGYIEQMQQQAELQGFTARRRIRRRAIQGFGPHHGTAVHGVCPEGKGRDEAAQIVQETEALRRPSLVC